jgi:putative hydrolase of the HAD superfamily
MKVRALIFDVYHTLLQIGPPPADADERWLQVGRDFFAEPLPVSLSGFSECTRALVQREHRVALAAGVEFPEIVWPQIVAEALRELRAGDEAVPPGFLRVHLQLLRTLTLMPGAAELLRLGQARELALGIASNAQHYTLAELDELLAPTGLSLNLFDPQLCFWSFENGFSKPNPHVFRILGARLWARGIPPQATLMIGDRLDNDIRPAQRQGWQTWHLSAQPADSIGGSCAELAAWLEAQSGD